MLNWCFVPQHCASQLCDNAWFAHARAGANVSIWQQLLEARNLAVNYNSALFQHVSRIWKSNLLQWNDTQKMDRAGVCTEDTFLPAAWKSCRCYNYVLPQRHNALDQCPVWTVTPRYLVSFGFFIKQRHSFKNVLIFCIDVTANFALPFKCLKNWNRIRVFPSLTYSQKLVTRVQSNNPRCASRYTDCWLRLATIM